MANPRVFFDLAINSKAAGRLIFELFHDTVPKTADNFKFLCTGEKGNGTSGKPLYFKGNQFHRIIPGFMAQGGDFTHGTGVGGESIYGQKFSDENFKIKHTKKGQLSMANSGRNTNGSQFFLTFVPCPWLDGKHVVFGEVVKGLEILAELEKYGTQDGRPTAKVVISDCGIEKSETGK